MNVYVATHNAGKLRELRSLLAPAAWRLSCFAGYRDVVEGDESYAANAALKARALHAQLRNTDPTGGVIGDDSGLEVGALGGRPGVLSARYGGAATWPQRRAALLAEIAASESADRSARFVCALHYIDGDGRELTAEGEVRGRIVLAERGDGGFSYDAIFAPDDHDRTFAEMPPAHKDALSHRARAVANLLEAVRRGARNVEAPGCSSAW